MHGPTPSCKQTLLGDRDPLAGHPWNTARFDPPRPLLRPGGPRRYRTALSSTCNYAVLPGDGRDKVSFITYTLI